MRNEFDGNPKVPDGFNIPENIGLNEIDVWLAMLILVSYATFLRIAAFFVFNAAAKPHK